jgi:hypothetical protein
MAGEAAAAGLNTAEGMSQLLGVIKQLDARMEAGKLVAGMKTFLEYTKEGTTQMERFEKAGVEFKPDMTPFERIEAILTKERALEIVPKVYTGPALAVFEELSKPYLKAVEEARGAGKDFKEAKEIGMDAFRKSLSDATESTWDYKKMMDVAADIRAEDPAKKMREAMDRIQRAFTQPEMIEAIEALAKQLPWLAKKMAELISWIAENPFKAIGAYGGLKLGLPALGGFASNLGAQLLPKVKGIFGIAGKAAVTAAKTAATTTVSAATTVATSLKAGAAGAGTAFLGVLGSAAVGAAIGSAIHAYITGPQAEEAAKKAEKAEEVGIRGRQIAVSPTATIEEKVAAAKEIRRQQMKLPETLATFESGMGFVAAAFTDVKSPLEQVEERQQRLKRAHDDLTNSIKLQRAGLDTSRSGLDRFAKALEWHAGKLEREAPTGGPRGTSHLANKPGAEPESG